MKIIGSRQGSAFHITMIDNKGRTREGNLIKTKNWEWHEYPKDNWVFINQGRVGWASALQHCLVLLQEGLL